MILIPYWINILATQLINEFKRPYFEGQTHKRKCDSKVALNFNCHTRDGTIQIMITALCSLTNLLFGETKGKVKQINKVHIQRMN